MLFPRNGLASGPQACFFTEKNKREGGKLGNPVDTLSPILLISQYIGLIIQSRKGIRTL
jgi:hypothetical protein